MESVVMLVVSAALLGNGNSCDGNGGDGRGHRDGSRDGELCVW